MLVTRPPLLFRLLPTIALVLCVAAVSGASGTELGGAGAPRAGAPIVQLAQADDLVREVQRSLTDKGYEPGPVDGAMGAGTRSALRQFQADAGLAVTGRVDDPTVAALRAEPARAWRLDPGGAVTASPTNERRIALVIGNSDYDTGPLPNPARDAELMAQTLRDVGFEVIARTDANQLEMKRAIQAFGDSLNEAGQDGVGLFYYAGHGVQAGGRNYLVPVGARIQRESDMEIEGVAADWVLAQMEYARNRLNLVVLDACRNNPFARSFRSGASGLARMDAPSGTLIAYSTAPGAVATDGTGRNSPYTAALAAAMGRPGLAVERVFKQVRIKVMEQTDGQQTPWEASSLTGEFAFVPGRREALTVAATGSPRLNPPSLSSPGATTTTVAPPTSPPPAVTTPVAIAPSAKSAKDKAVEMAWWQSMGNSNNPADYRAYLDRFGDGGEFARLAKARIASLRPGGGREAASRAQVSDIEAAKAAIAKAEAFVADLKANSDGMLAGAASAMPLEKRIEVFRGFLGAVVDFEPMARFSLGSWKDRIGDAEFEEYRRYYEALFLEFYEFTKGDLWTGEIEVAGVRPYGPDYLVTVTLTPPRGGPSEVGLRLRRKDGSYFGFMIIDVLWKGVSLLVTQRADFKGTLQKGGVPGLIEWMQGKVGYQEEVIDIPR